MLAILYSEGRGAAADIDEAIAWCKKSKAQGFDNAAKLLPALEARKRKQKSFWKFFS
jgi:TPR repeat protein